MRVRVGVGDRVRIRVRVRVGVRVRVSYPEPFEGGGHEVVSTAHRLAYLQPGGGADKARDLGLGG